MKIKTLVFKSNQDESPSMVNLEFTNRPIPGDLISLNLEGKPVWFNAVQYQHVPDGKKLIGRLILIQTETVNKEEPKDEPIEAVPN